MIKLGMDKTFSDKVLSEHLKMEERSKKHAILNDTLNKKLMTNGSDSVSNSMISSPPKSSEYAPNQRTPKMKSSPGI
jgi:hypothetical protein